MSPDDIPQYLRIEQHLIYCWLLLALGRHSDARRLLARLQGLVQERGLYGWLITVHVLLVLTAERSGNHPVACDHLAQALRIAALGDYVRAFLDEDGQVIALLPAVRHVAPEFVGRLLEEVVFSRPQPTRSDSSLIEPLSERELEVLRLIAAGLSDLEVARELVITIGAVKRHINHIYGKLEVHSAPFTNACRLTAEAITQRCAACGWQCSGLRQSSVRTPSLARSNGPGRSRSCRILWDCRLSVLLAADSLTERATQPFEDGGLQQESLDVVALPLEDFIEQVIHDVALAAGEWRMLR